MKTELITSPTTGIPLEMEDIKDHLRISIGETNEDEYLEGLRELAVEYAENYTGRKIRTQTWKAYFDDFPAGESFPIPYTPLQSVPSSGIYYTDSSGGSTTFSSSKWTADTVSEPGRVVLDAENYDWPTDTLATLNPVSVEFVCGYTTSNQLPKSIKHAMLLMIGHWYENRENTIVGPGQVIHRIPAGAEALLENYRLTWF